MENLLHKVLLSGGIFLSATAWAQHEVDMKKYTDYQPVSKADAGLRASTVRSGETRPDHVHNGLSRFFPPVFNQDGGSCGSASRICYMFTHEINSFRNLDGSQPENYYPSHFSWLLTNGNSGKDAFVANIGIPSAALYGGQTYSKYFGNQDTANDDFGWMQGYDKWFAAMHNRMEWPVSFPDNVSTEAGREAVKQYLWNHNGDPDFHGGGIVGIGVASAATLASIASTEANNAAKVTGKKYIQAWGTQVDHALTIVGYDDRIEFDLNGNGIYGEKSADEVGAWIIVNSWGTGWADGGFVYCPYAYGGAYSKLVDDKKVFDTNSWWKPEVYHVRKNYRPLRTIKLKMNYSRRSELYLTAGISADLNAEMPDQSIAFDHFKYAGDGNYGNTVPAPEVPMLGRWTDGLHHEPMEFGYDLTDLSAQFDKNRPLKYFFIVETKNTAVGEGRIHSASIIDYEENLAGVEMPFDLGNEGVEIKNAGNKTIISVVVQGQGYYAPQNLTATDGVLSWMAPLGSAHTLTGYEVYTGGECIATLGTEETSYELPDGATGNYEVKALYGNRRWAAVTAVVAVADTKSNRVIQLRGSGFTIKNAFGARYDKATIEYWLRPASLSNWNQSAGPGWGQFMLHANSNGSFSTGWDTSNRINTAASTLKVNQWTHIAIVVDGNKMTVYANGQEAGTITSENHSGLGGFGDLTFRNNSTGDQTNGHMDEIRIWKSARTAEEIAANMNVTFGDAGLPADLLVYYKGDIIVDGGEKKLRERVAGNHAIMLNTNFVSAVMTTPALKPVTDLSVNINEPSEEVYAGIPTTFAATASSSATELSWTAEGAGVKDAKVKRPALTFTAAGDQKVSVTAYDRDGKTATADLTVNVKEAPAPVADFTMTTTTIPVDGTISFIAGTPRMGYIYEWSMPGAETEEALTTNAAATYTAVGTYTVTLTVKAPDGRTATSSKEVKVEAVAPNTDFDVAPAVIMKGETTFLKDKSRHQPTSWNWTIQGDAKSFAVNGQNSSLTINEPGIYDVTLKTANEVGSSMQTQKGALVVCNADSKQGLNFSSGEGSVTMKKLPLTRGQRTFTIDWWMNPSALTGDLNGFGDPDNNFSVFTTAQGLLVLNMKASDGKNYSAYTAANTVKPQSWHHYAVTFDKGQVSFYVDGTLSHSMSISATIIPSITEFVMSPSKYPLTAIIDEFRIWGKTLTAEQIRQYANEPIADVAAAERDNDLRVYYNFNQSGGDVKDATSNANDGVRRNFGPDGDAWSSSKGVFCLSNSAGTLTDVTQNYLVNYTAPFKNDGTSVNPANSSRFLGLADWTLQNQIKENGVTTGAHVDTQKGNSMTITSLWDNFSTVKDHKVFQTVTLPAGAYTFTAEFSNWEGEPVESYLVAAAGKTLPVTDSLATKALGYTKMLSKAQTMTNSVSFILTEETEVSLGILANINGRRCVTFKQFSLSAGEFESIEADNSGGHTLTVDASGWASLFLNYATSIPEGVKAYVAVSRGTSELVLNPIEDGIIPAQTAVIIEAEPETYLFAPTTTAGTATSLLQGTLSDLTTTAGQVYYTVQKPAATDEAVMGRHTGTVIPANTAYLTADTAGAPEAYTFSIVPTGIGGINTPIKGNDAVYDLSGRRVKQPSKGFYIIGGKKVIVK